MPACSTGFCVARTRKGEGSSRVSPSMVTCRSCIASSNALCVFAGARLISSPSTTFAKIGPSRREKTPSFGDNTNVPVMSAGSRSGVNWIRRKLHPSVAANALTSVVFATPGTPSSSTCPLASRQVRMSSGTSRGPT